MKIIRLTISDVGGIEAFELSPDGGHVVIGGKNAAGKSSVLSAIAGALGGARERKSERVRRGAPKGEVVVELDDLIVRWRTTAEGRDYLQVESTDGAVYKSPQAMLDKLWGARTFDPLAFFRSEPREQARQLAELAGVDLDAIEAMRRAAFDERTGVNRVVRELEAQAADPAYQVPDGTPGQPVDEAELTKDVQSAAQTNAGNAQRRAALERLEADLRSASEGVDEIGELGQTTIEETRVRCAQVVVDAEAALHLAQKALETAKARAASDLRIATERAHANKDAAIERARALAEKLAADRPDVIALVDVDVAAATSRLAEARNINRAVEMRRSRTRLLAGADAQRSKAAELTATIEAAQAEKAASIAAAELPIDGLGIEDGHVTYQGRRLEILSSSEQLRVSVALGIAMHPKIAVLLLDRWGDLDEDSRRIVREMADAAGCQIWTTVVGERDEDITVTIREGRIAEEAA